jgi:DNA transposition AAA+ family ATPase
MTAQWTGSVVGEMHLNKVTMKQLADELGWHPKYLSAVLNGHRNPKKAEEKIRDALCRIIERKEQNNAEDSPKG